MRGIAKTISKCTFCSEQEEDPATSLRALLARKRSAETREVGRSKPCRNGQKGDMMSQRAPAQRHVSKISCVHHHSARESILRTNLESREPDAKGQNGMKLAKMIQKCKKCKEHTRRAISRFYRRWKALTNQGRGNLVSTGATRHDCFFSGRRTDNCFCFQVGSTVQNQVDAERGHAHLLHAHTGHTSM